MSDKIKRFLVADARDAAAAASTGLPCAFLIYRISSGGILQRAHTTVPLRGSMMGIYDAGGLAQADPAVLCRTIRQECRRYGFCGVLLDTEDPALPAQQLEELSRLLQQAGIPHLVPPAAAAAASAAKILLPSSVSGGSFQQMLDDFSARAAPQQLCLALERCCADFPMPAADGKGTRLTPAQFRDLLQQHRPNSYFSQPLCCKYFTYRCDGQVHFVLYDDADTAAQKVRLAQQAGFFAALTLYRDWGTQSRQALDLQ